VRPEGKWADGRRLFVALPHEKTAGSYVAETPTADFIHRFESDDARSVEGHGRLRAFNRMRCNVRKETAPPYLTFLNYRFGQCCNMRMSRMRFGELDHSAHYLLIAFHIRHPLCFS
jgi:hypothetical protein